MMCADFAALYPKISTNGHLSVLQVLFFQLNSRANFLKIFVSVISCPLSYVEISVVFVLIFLTSMVTVDIQCCRYTPAAGRMNESFISLLHCR